jgi:uncharacterized protein (TIGR02285 family)
MGSSKPIKILLCLALIAAGVRAFGQDNLTVNLLYNERPPYHYTDENGKVVGLLADIANKVFAVEGIPYRWKLTPVNRIMKVLSDNSGVDCAVGWYKTPEREEFAAYTLPIYVELPTVGVARSDTAIPERIAARELLSRPDIRLLLKQGLNYGDYLTVLIDKMPAGQVQRISDEMPILLKMLVARRANLTVLTSEELSTVIKQAGFTESDFKIIRFPDLKKGMSRHIMCSRNVPPEILKKLDAAIKGL